MWHEFSLAHLTALSLSPPEMVEVAANTGYSYVGLRLLPVTANEPKYPIAQDRKMMQETIARIANTGVGVLDIELARLAPDTNVVAFVPMLEAGAALGARHVIAQACDADRSRALDNLCRLCELARPFRIGVELEFVTWSETPDLQSAVTLLKQAGDSNAGILIDTLHFARSRCSLELLRSLPPSWLRMAQLCDAPAEPPTTKEGLIHAARNERRFLGEGGLDIKAVVECMPPDTPYSLEIPTSTLSRMLGPEVRAHMALLTARRYLSSIPNRRTRALATAP